MRRFLVISEEVGMMHLDIIIAKSAQGAMQKSQGARPKTESRIWLDFPEVEKIYLAMKLKTDKEIEAKFLENTK